MTKHGTEIASDPYLAELANLAQPEIPIVPDALLRRLARGAAEFDRGEIPEDLARELAVTLPDMAGELLAHRAVAEANHTGDDADLRRLAMRVLLTEYDITGDPRQKIAVRAIADKVAELARGYGLGPWGILRIHRTLREICALEGWPITMQGARWVGGVTVAGLTPIATARGGR